MPDGYIVPEDIEGPRMGAQAIDPSSPAFNKQPFMKNFICGFYEGKLIFIEPMMTKDFLETRPNSTDRIKISRSYAKNGYYPSAYSLRYDVVQQAFEVSLENPVYN